MFTTKQLQGFEFNSYPKDALNRSPDYTVVLRSNLRTYNYQLLPAALIRENRGELDGLLYATHTKLYSKSDKTRNGESKEGWRLLVLKGDGRMMA